MTEPAVRPVPEGIHTLTPHIVVRGAARAAEWYAEALGAEEQSRIPVPGGKLMSVELRFGDSTVMVADEFPEMGVLSPESVGGTYGALHLATEDVDALWERAVGAGAEVFHPLGDTFWGDRFGQIVDPFGHRAGGSPSACARSRTRRSCAPPPRRSAVRCRRGDRRSGPTVGRSTARRFPRPKGGAVSWTSKTCSCPFTCWSTSGGSANVLRPRGSQGVRFLSPIARSSPSPSSRSGPAFVASATSSGSPMPTFALTFSTSSPTANSTVASAPWRLN